MLIILQFERSREQGWSSCDRALASYQCSSSSIPRVDARNVGRGGVTSELAHPPPPTPLPLELPTQALEVHFLKYIHKVGSAKSINFEVQKFCEISTVRFWLHVLISYRHTALKTL